MDFELVVGFGSDHVFLEIIFEFFYASDLHFKQLDLEVNFIGVVVTIRAMFLFSEATLLKLATNLISFPLKLSCYFTNLSFYKIQASFFLILNNLFNPSKIAN